MRPIIQQAFQMSDATLSDDLNINSGNQFNAAASCSF